MQGKTLILILIAHAAPAWCFQTDLIFPWVTNQSQFRATLTINNLGEQSADLVLTATRAEGQVPETETVNLALDPFAQLVIGAGDLFPGMSEGTGYMVRLTSDSSKISGAYVVSGTQSASGSSPAQANVVPAAEAGTKLLFNFLFVDSEAGFAAPVIINLGAADAQITFHAYQGSVEVANAVRTVASLHPLAEITDTLFPEIQGDFYVVVESDQPLLGVAFIFNSLLEPSMSNAVPVDEVPAPGNGGNGGKTVSFAKDIQPIFDRSCGDGDCHLMGSSQSGLVLDAGVSYANIVNVPPTTPFFADLFLIEPGNADDSYLYRKLLPPSQAAYSPSRMPKNRPALPNEEIDLIRTWILEGAEDN